MLFIYFKVKNEHKLGDEWMGSSWELEKDLGVPVGEKPDSSRQRALTAQ